jgi:hypothetical protein
LDPKTGRSFTNANSLRPLDKVDYGTDTLSRFLSFEGFKLDPTASIKLSQGCHGQTLLTKFNLNDAPAVKIIRIDTDRADLKKIFWEYLIKTYMSQQRWSQAIQDSQMYNLDTQLAISGLPLTDNNRVELIEEIIKKEFCIWSTPRIEGLSCVTIEYDKLFTDNGSRELCQQLEFDVDDRYHQLWRKNLTMCNSPAVISKFGRTWSYSEIV